MDRSDIFYLRAADAPDLSTLQSRDDAVDVVPYIGTLAGAAPGTQSGGGAEGRSQSADGAQGAQAGQGALGGASEAAEG